MITFNPSKVRALMAKKKMTEYALAQHLHQLTGKNTTPALVGRWLKGEGEPGFSYTMAMIYLFKIINPEEFCDVDLP